MAVRAFTSEPQQLLSALKAAIASGKITAWTVDADGDLTHTSEQWRRKAWMRPKVLNDRLLFNIIAPTGREMTSAVYGIYHARLIQTLLIFFDRMTTTVTATSLGTSGDTL